MATKLKTIVTRALAIREKAGFTTETITKKRYKMAYIPDAIKQAAKELKSEPKVYTHRNKLYTQKELDQMKAERIKLMNTKPVYVAPPKPKPKRTKRLVKTKAIVKKAVVTATPKKRTKRVVTTKGLVKKAEPVAKGAPLVMKQERVRLTKKNFIRVSSKGKDFKATYGVTAMSVLKKSELESSKHISLSLLYEWMTKKKTADKTHFRTVTNEADFYGKFIEELAKNGKYLTGKRVVDIDRLQGYEFTTTDRMPPKGKAGMYGLDKIIGNDDIRPAMGGVFVADGNLHATDAHKLVIIKDTENQAKKYDGKIVGIRKKDFNVIIDAKYPNFQAVIPQMDKQPHVSDWVAIDDVLAWANGCNIVLKSISGTSKFIVLNVKGSKVAVHAAFFVDTLNVLRSNGSKKLKIGASDASRAIIMHTDNGNFGLTMPIMVNDIETRDNFMFKPFKLN